MKIISFICLVLILSTLSCKVQESSGYCPSDLSTEGLKSNLIRDCPETLIRNQMPFLGESKKRTSQYYIYKGLRREISEFDSVWVSKNCKVKEIIAQ
ncbi:MAG: hypothetical protein V4580_15550 [Bacteroidota bacterium]